MPRPAEQDAVSSLSRGLALLELFSMDESELSISEMARRAQIPKSTTHRLVTDLLEWGALERGRGGVRLGVRLFELGSLVPDHARLRELAIPFAHSLNQITQLTSNLAVREGNEIIYLEKISARDLRVPHSRVGGRLPMHCTALGKAILAHAPVPFIERVLSEPLVRLTPATITEPEVLRRELPEIRTRGVAYDIEESQLGLFCVGAPIFARQGQVIGALSVTGATSLDQARRFSGAVHAAANALSHALGAPLSPSTRYAGRRVATVTDIS
ncbi:IclR family transcriptional regulator [Nocardioides sp. DS6]|uniref:IclR family transcriptional regulator n=1 Tax=Nocardioides eburneus TaxID=3231482 RepID=A0ABV3T0B7_9ACTN